MMKVTGRVLLAMVVTGAVGSAGAQVTITRSASGGVTIMRSGPPVEGEPEPVDEVAMPEVQVALPPGGVEEAGAAGGLSKEEIAELRGQYEGLSKDEQREMTAYYKDVGLDLDATLGISSAAMADAQRLQEAVMMLGQMDFARTPANVLGARAKLGFGQVPHPNPTTARGNDIATWIHLQVMAGEWGGFASYLEGRPKDEAQSLYSRVLQSLNAARSELLPEEVLAITEACPDEPKAWQTAAWASMMKAATAKNSPATMLALVKEGTKFFGAGDSVKRRRTIDLLAAAGLMAQAYEYVTPLDEARAAGDGDLVLVHALYQADLANKLGAAAGSGPEAMELRNRAWDLFTEASLMDRTSMRGKKEAIKQAIGLMSRMPRSKVTPWLRSVFADDALGTAALETIVLSAAAVGEGKADGGAPRAEAIVTLKEAVDILLERRGVDQSVLRVPMRMLTTSVVAEMETTAEARNVRPSVTAQNAQLLLRAIPSGAWFDALEPSLASRAAKASIGIAILADETDIALGLVADAIRRSPEQARSVGESFLKSWEGKLSPKSEYDDDMMMYYFWREYVAQAPLTRGRQRRNLERLGRLMETLEAAGVEARTLPGMAGVFKACHGMTEVYERSDIERVFGPMAEIPAGTAAGLAQTMAASLNGDWRNRAVQVKQGVNRTDTEIAQLVDKGYGVALALMDSAMTHQPDSWRFAVVKAGLAYDRLQFKASQKKNADPAKAAEYRVAAFAAFEKAAERYAEAIGAGEDREDAGVYARWFGAAMGTSQLNFLVADDMPVEGTPQDDQVDKIRKAIGALPPDVASRHLAEFARTMSEAVTRCDPEVKPKLVKHALRVVGDHPAGAALRTLDELYKDLVKDEIKLRLTLDGDDRGRAGKQFGVMVSLRFTNPVDRETGGFAKYLQTSVYVRVGRQYQEVNFREKLQKNIETSFAKGFTVESIGFFDPFMPPKGVIEGGEDGWIEKPMAYVLLSRKDPTVDRLPQLTLDMQFEDQTGPVTLVLPSNTPAVAVGAAAAGPVHQTPDLNVMQALDPRDARDGEKDKTIKLEVMFRGKGVVPDLRDVLAGIDDAIPGYTITETGVEARPALVVQEGDSIQSRFFYYGQQPTKPPEGGYPEPDEHGMYRLPVERSWVVTYTPTDGEQGKQFVLPRLRDGVQATVESKVYSDMDLVPVVGSTVAVERQTLLRPITVGLVMIVLLVGAVVVYRRMRVPVVAVAAGEALPSHITPLTAVMALRRMAPRVDASRRGELEREIAMIELKYFGPGENAEANGELGEALRRWVGVGSGEGAAGLG